MERDHVQVEDEEVQGHYSHVIGLFEQAVMLVAQAARKTEYRRRQSGLYTLIDIPSKVKDLLNNFSKADEGTMMSSLEQSLRSTSPNRLFWSEEEFPNLYNF